MPTSPPYRAIHGASTLGASLDELIQTMRYSGVAFTQALEEFERRWLLQELEAARGNQCVVAREMRIHRNTLARRMQSIGLVWRGRIHYQTRARKGQSVTGEVTNSVRKGGRGESPEQPPASRSSRDRLDVGGLISCGRLTEDTR